MSTFVVVKSKSKLCNRTTYIREFKLTLFAFKKIYYITRGFLRMSKVSSDSGFLNFVVSLTESHTSDERFERLASRCLLFYLSLIPIFFRRADRPSSFGILGYNPTTSTEHKIISLGKSVKERSFFKKSLVSFM